MYFNNQNAIWFGNIQITNQISFVLHGFNSHVVSMMKSIVLADSPGNIQFLPPIVTLPKMIEKYHPTKLMNLLTYYHQTLAIHSDRKVRKGYTIIILNSNSQSFIIITIIIHYRYCYPTIIPIIHTGITLQ